MKNFLVFSFIALWSLSLTAQDKVLLKKEQDSIYQSNIKKTRLYGVYIPKDLNEAFIELDRLSPPDELLKLKSADEQTVAKKLHFGLGRWMAHNWNFEDGSRFSHYLKGLGLVYVDDMIDFMLISYHRYLNKKDQEIVERIKWYQDFREKEAAKNRTTSEFKKG